LEHDAYLIIVHISSPFPSCLFQVHYFILLSSMHSLEFPPSI
jgi:hypothetical protein